MEFTAGCWDVTYQDLVKCIDKLDYLIVQYLHPAFNHTIVFTFQRAPLAHLLELVSLDDNADVSMQTRR